MRRRRILTAKRGFTTWAMLVYAFLYLPILVVVIFAFNKPSATSSRRSTAQHLQHPRLPTSATSRSGTASRRAGSTRASTTSLYTPAIKTSFFIALRRRRSSRPSSGSAPRSRWRA